jgi:hypothetical protein
MRRVCSLNEPLPAYLNFVGNHLAVCSLGFCVNSERSICGLGSFPHCFARTPHMRNRCVFRSDMFVFDRLTQWTVSVETISPLVKVDVWRRIEQSSDRNASKCTLGTVPVSPRIGRRVSLKHVGDTHRRISTHGCKRADNRLASACLYQAPPLRDRSSSAGRGSGGVGGGDGQVSAGVAYFHRWSTENMVTRTKMGLLTRPFTHRSERLATAG